MQKKCAKVSVDLSPLFPRILIELDKLGNFATSWSLHCAEFLLFRCFIRYLIRVRMKYHSNSILLVFRALVLIKILAVAVGLRSFGNRVMVERRPIGNRLLMPGVVKLLEGMSVHTVMATAGAWIEVARARVVTLAVGREELRRYERVLCSHHGCLSLWLLEDLRRAVHGLCRDSAHSSRLFE